MHPCPGGWLRSLQLLRGPQYPPPRRIAVQVAGLKHGIRPHGGMDRRVLAVVLHEEVGGAVDVEGGDHSRHTRLTAASASEAVMSNRAYNTARTASSVWLRRTLFIQFG